MTTKEIVSVFEHAGATFVRKAYPQMPLSPFWKYGERMEDLPPTADKFAPRHLMPHEQRLLERRFVHSLAR